MNYLNDIKNIIVANIGYAEMVIYAVMGALIAYYKTSTKLQKFVADLIAQAESTYGSGTGGAKFAWVTSKVYALVPLPLKAIINEQMIGDIVQGTFNSMAAYARTQLDKLVDTAVPDTTGTEGK